MFFLGLWLFPCGITVSFVIRHAKKAVKKNKHKKKLLYVRCNAMSKFKSLSK